MRKVNFDTQEEKEALIKEAENNGEILSEVANLLNENYLIFKTLADIEPEIVTEEVDEEKAALAEAIIDLDARLSALEGGVIND